MEKCVKGLGHSKILGSDHPHAIAYSNVSNDWETAAKYLSGNKTQQKFVNVCPALFMQTLPPQAY
ncbi:hypothetical protein BDV27DRAFT_128417 [Aspergillus caelatus]|uniref:Uncharacterized protein n=1 Tax=Aspergillus caelatus TaxID=61420 RepID=A0A5N7A3M8_9EURO|nr:uncharacterized protein BDV27DRAFT_128417 [Aspergillus caelatus]KAE8364467.1 hypothetical protein BDV27DRAFT_128417 [Aspergillus caelatus]